MCFEALLHKLHYYNTRDCIFVASLYAKNTLIVLTLQP